jgi:hypothetical protein
VRNSERREPLRSRWRGPHRGPSALHAVIAALLVTLIASHAAGQIPNLALTWDAPVGCPSSSEVERSVDRMMGHLPPNDRKIDAHVIVTRRPSGLWMAELVITGSASGKRELEGESCAAIALATSVVLAFAIDPRAGSAPPEEPKEHPIPISPEAPVIKTPINERTVFYAHAFGGAALRTLPTVAGEFGLGVGLRRGRWEAELSAAYAPTRSIQVVGPPRAGADVGLWSATAFGCFAPIATTWAALDLCVGGELEHMSAEATGVSNPGSGSALLFSPTGAVRSRIRLFPRLALALDLAATVRQFHPRFVIDGVGQVYDIPIVGASLGAGLQLEL